MKPKTGLEGFEKMVKSGPKKCWRCKGTGYMKGKRGVKAICLSCSGTGFVGL